MTNETLNTVVAAAKAKAINSPEWLRAIEKAAAMLATGDLVVTLFADNTALVTSPNGSYRVNGSCPCAARTPHCYHRAAKRLVEMAETAPATSVSFDTEVEAAFAAKFPGYHIADYLLKFYGQNSLQFMNRELVADIHALILAA